MLRVYQSYPAVSGCLVRPLPGSKPGAKSAWPAVVYRAGLWLIHRQSPCWPGPSQYLSDLPQAPGCLWALRGPYQIPTEVLSLPGSVEFTVQAFGSHHSVQVVSLPHRVVGWGPARIPVIYCRLLSD